MDVLLLATYCFFAGASSCLERSTTNAPTYRAFFVMNLFLRNRVTVVALFSVVCWPLLRALGVSGEVARMAATGSLAIGLMVSLWITYRTMPSARTNSH